MCIYHTGVLCGLCEASFILSLSSSRCLPCPDYWPAAMFISITIAVIATGLALVAIMFALIKNLTLAVMLNGLFFSMPVLSLPI